MLIFDGDCAACSSVARFAERRIGVVAVPWQRVDLARHGLTAAQCATAVQWVAADGSVASGAAACAAAMRAGGAVWGVVGRVIALPGVSWLAERAYGVVARNRHRLPGGTASCAHRSSPSATNSDREDRDSLA